MPEASDVLWTNTAEEDLREIIEYIREDSPQTAIQILNGIVKEVSKLNLFPNRGRIIPELSKNNIMRYRELTMSPWRIFYKPEGNKIYIMAVIDVRKNIEDILLHRALR